ncbi:hypothetical protein [Chitinilyticum piscinae]|uniref:Uncharacterized protein n=1 Tax=Chitinilyticum piscinae TaxID=2866724 RepID=A0A8J7FJ00_9NEIS|nr:hypothetical protein [Chitinilyticum piscinae]MBE9608702.1 hypothetical protein [Chitinilyticum piscinae]
MRQQADLRQGSRQALEAGLLALLGEAIRAYFPEPDESHPALWTSLVFQHLRSGIRGGDAIAIGLACQLLVADAMLPFGKLIKSNLARALKQKAPLLSPAQGAMLISVTQRLTALPYAPRELEDYRKLVKTLQSCGMAG